MPSRYVPMRVSEAGYALLAARAAEETDGNVSELLRRLLKWAAVGKPMPKGWH